MVGKNKWRKYRGIEEDWNDLGRLGGSGTCQDFPWIM